MSESNSIKAGRFAPDLEQRVGNIMHHVAIILAMLGGLVLVAIVILTVLSITGRAFLAFGLGPIPGDFELVESGTAFAVFSFLPWCQLQRGHVTVDIVVQRMGQTALQVTHLIGNVLMAAISTVIFWRLILGTIDKKQYHETTFILQFPVWWSYLAACLGALVFCLVSYYTVWRSANELTGERAVVATPVIH